MFLSVVDYGVGNLRSIAKSIEKANSDNNLNYSIKITSDVNDIKKSDKIVLPGQGSFKACKEGIDKIFKEAGFEWREPGCSMCLGMNPDQLKPKERCASTSNRNFEGRQGRGGRTHLVSPGMAIAAAIKGHLSDVREI